MAITYFKRYRMEVPLPDVPLVPKLPEGYRFLEWDLRLIDVHADAMCGSFQHEQDATLFPCLGDPDGCRRVMRDIAARPGFLPSATWLVSQGERVCATIQGVEDSDACGSIQNLGVMPWARGFGVGRALLLKALEGFRQHGLARAFLEVTADNRAALRLYRAVGFVRAKTVFRSVSNLT